MQLKLLLPCLLLLSISCKPVDTPTIPVLTKPRPFPSGELISIYESYARSGDDLSPVPSSIESFQEIHDSILKECFPELRFYTLTVNDPSAMEYDMGNIRCLAAVPVAGNDIRLLLPTDFIDNQSDFVSLFYKRSVQQKEDICKAINHLFVSIIPMHAFNCDKTLWNLQEKAITYNDTVMVTTSWTHVCKENYQPFESPEYRTLLFTFYDSGASANGIGKGIRWIGPFTSVSSN